MNAIDTTEDRASALRSSLDDACVKIGEMRLEMNAKDAAISELREALQGLHDDVVEYVTINKLHDADGSPAINNHWMKRARAVLSRTGE